MEIITTEEVMDKLDMFQSRFGKIDKFGWWDLEIISEFQDECQTCCVHIMSSAL